MRASQALTHPRSLALSPSRPLSVLTLSLDPYPRPRPLAVDIYRMKGVLAMAGCDDRYVYQGVHMLFTGETLGPWGDAPRVSRLIFIGKNLDRASLEASFAACLEEAPAK